MKKILLKDRGVQRHGYSDPKTKRFIFVKEMVPELVVPDLTDFEVINFVAFKFRNNKFREKVKTKKIINLY